MERRKYIEGLGAVVATGALAGCSGNETGNGQTDDGSDTGGDDTDGSTEYGILSTSITDQPNDIGDFAELVVTIQGIWVKPAGVSDDEDDSEDGEADEETDEEEPSEEGTDEEVDEESDQTGNETGETDDEKGVADESGGRYYIEFEEPQEADLVDLQGDNTQLIGETELEVGDYQFLQLDVSETNGILTSDEEAEVETPGNAPLQFKQAFEIRAEERTRFIADFAPFRTGPPDSARYRIRPVASGTRVLYGDEGTDEEADEGSDEGTDEEAGGEEQTEDGPDTGSNETENSTETSE